jgi:hypothetical protein
MGERRTSLKKTAQATGSVKEGTVIDPGFAQVMKAFAKDRQVSRSGRGFGSTGLKVNGKLFAMVSGRTRKFVVKLPKERVDALVRAGQGEPFDPGHGRRMKEWIAVDGADPDWVELAREARRFVGGSHQG